MIAVHFFYPIFMGFRRSLEENKIIMTRRIYINLPPSCVYLSLYLLGAANKLLSRPK